MNEEGKGFCLWEDSYFAQPLNPLFLSKARERGGIENIP